VPGKCTEARIVLGAVAPVPMRAKRAEEVLLGRSLDDSLLEQAADAASAECFPRSSTEYKRELVKVITGRALREALKLSELA
jgi:aerobic carbon-monoxide dehydrogenase medium subunit